MKNQSSLRPRFTSFEDAGVIEALQRGVALLGIGAEEVDLDFWTSSFDGLTFRVLDGKVATSKFYDVATKFCELEQKVNEETAQLLSTTTTSTSVAQEWREATNPAGSGQPLRNLSRLSALSPHSAFGAIPETRMAIATVRLCIGAAVEGAFAKAAVKACWTPGKTAHLGKTKHLPETWAKTPDGKRQLTASRLYHDAALVATWTSAHAVFIEDCQSGVLEAPTPSIFSVPNSFVELNFSDLFARRQALKDKNMKGALPLLSLFLRALNTSARGWEGLLESLVPKSTCMRSLIGQALTVSLTGMHETVHPALRLPWRARHVLMHRVGAQINGSKLLALLSSATSAIRESVRRLLVSSVSCMPAATRALGAIGHPVRMLQCPPLCIPAPGLEAVAECFAVATRNFSNGSGAQSLQRALVHAFDQPLPNPRMKYDPTWLGKGTAPPPSIVPFVKTAGEVFAQAFRAQMLPLWLHAFHYGERASRLESVFYKAIHELNAATALVAELDEKTALHMQRLAIGHVSSALLSGDDVFRATGLSAELCKFPLEENELDVDYEDRGKGLGPTDDEFGRQLAMALSWARAAWISEKIIFYELGTRTTGMQILAILRRLDSPRKEEAARLSLAELARRRDDFLQGLPEQSTHLQACLFCGRVANPICNDAKPNLHFNDVGASVAMNCTACNPTKEDYGVQHLRCAKRASAALRQAVLFEADAVAKQVEQQPVDLSAVQAILSTASAQRATASGIGARAKRDAKSALEQYSSPVGCGDDALLVVPLVGRCIQLSGVKYALCAFCAAAVRVEPDHRAGGEIACLRCDGRLLTGFGAKAKSDLEASEARVCRFCGKVERTAGTHRSYKAPFDTAGRNATLPAPLRTVSFCPVHQKSWLQPALRNLPTRSILAHISFGARPIFGAASASKLSSADLGLADDMMATDKKRGKKRKM